MKISYNIRKMKLGGLSGLLLFTLAMLANLNAGAQYCSPSGPVYGFCCSPNDMGILGFNLGSISTSDGKPTVVYKDYSATQSTSVSIGQTVNFTYTLNPGYQQYLRIWVDWNSNNTFDASELMYDNQFSALNSQSGSFVVPCASPGAKRIRVAADYYGVAPPYGYSPMAPCGSIYYGNMHDYTLNIATPPPVKAQFTTSDTVFVNSSFKAINAAAAGSMQFQWDFNNDGTIEATTLHAIYTFTTTGVKDIKLKAYSCTAADSVVRTVVVVSPTQAPVADFIASKYTVLPFETISMQDMSTNGPTRWKWEVTPIDPYMSYLPNDTAQNPDIIFGSAGVYTVCLTATNSIGASQKTCKTSYINVKAINNMCIFPDKSVGTTGELYDSGGPTANYASNENCTFIIAPCASSVTLKFTQWAIGSPAASLKIYNGKNATAPLIGTYTNASGAPGAVTNGVTANSGSMFLVWTSGPSTSLAAGYAATWTSVQSTGVVVTPNFTSPDTAYEMTDVFFKNTSTGTGLDYDWDLDGDGISDANSTDATFQYPAPGTYITSLTISDACGNLKTKTDSIVITVPTQAPVADFTADIRVVTTSDTVKFTDLSTFGPWDWLYTFTPVTATIVGGTAKNPWVRFNAAGSYNVKLDAKNSVGTGTITKTGYINVVNICQGSTSGLVPDLGINRVKLGAIDNITASGVSGFTSYFSSVAPAMMDAGGTYSLTVTRNSTLNKMNRKVWIDYNADGDFNDAGELVGSEAAALTPNWTLTFTVPVSATRMATRMRIGTAFADSTNLPCGPNFYGEIEEYRVVINNDITPPVITLNGSNPLTIELGDPYVEPGATAVDAVDGNLSSSIVITHTINNMVSGTYTVKYNVQDASGNAAVEVVRTVIVTKDFTPPVLKLNTPLIVTIPVFSSYTEPGYSATDNISGNITSSVIVDGSALDTSKVGTYIIKYTVYDADSNPDMKTRIVNVVDLIAPVITLNGANPFEVEVFNTFTDPGAQVNDNYDLVISATSISNVNTNVLGTYTVTYTAIDASGNIASEQRQVNVVDKTIPVISVFGPETLVVEVFGTYVKPYITATDNYDLHPVISTIGSYSLSTIGDYWLKYVAVDGSGNQSIPDSVLLRVVDIREPVITLNGASLITVKRWSDFVDPDVEVDDNYYPKPLLKSMVVKGGNFTNTMVEGLFYITYDVTDPSGNKAEQVVRTVNVVGLNTSIGDVTGEMEIKLYPNPANENVTLELINSSFSKGRIDIVNMLGKTVRSITPEEMSTNQHIEISDLAAGVYFLHVENKGEIALKRLVISR